MTRTKTNFVTQQQLKTIRGGAGIGHVHSNKDVLDLISSDMIHYHDNKDIIDSITQDMIDGWEESRNLAHSHQNRAALDLLRYNAELNIIYVGDENNRVSFAAYGNVAAGGIGTGGGGAKFLYQLEDIYNNGPIILRADGTARQNGDALTYDSTQNKWIASPIQSGASSFAQLTGSPYENTSLATALNNKQDAISDLATIRSQAANGQTAYGWGNHASAGYITSSGSCAYAASAGNADTLDGQHSSYFQPLATAINTGNIGSQSVAYATNAGMVNNHTVNADVPSGAVFTDTHDTNSAGTGIAVSGTRGSTIAINSTYQTYISHGESAYNSLGNYLPLSGGTMTGGITGQGRIISTNQWGVIAGAVLLYTSADSQFLGAAGDGSVSITTYIRSSGDNLYHRSAATGDHKIYDSGNCNNASTPWSCSNLTASGNATISGNVGIGTTSPSGKLDAVGKVVVGTGGEINPLSLRRAHDGAVSYTIGSKGTSGIDSYTMRILNKSDHGMSVDLINGTMTANGNIVASGNVAAGSDARWKHNITPVVNGIDAIMKLQPSEWEWNSDGHKDSGLVAQQVREVLPHLVKESNDGFLHLNYNGLHAYEISALQNHESRIEQLERENIELKLEIQRLRS